VGKFLRQSANKVSVPKLVRSRDKSDQRIKATSIQVTVDSCAVVATTTVYRTNLGLAVVGFLGLGLARVVDAAAVVSVVCFSWFEVRATSRVRSERSMFEGLATKATENHVARKDVQCLTAWIRLARHLKEILSVFSPDEDSNILSSK
jgi:hypothetical protein